MKTLTLSVALATVIVISLENDLLQAIPLSVSDFQQSPFQNQISNDSTRFAVSVNGKIGFINNKGEQVIHPQFESSQEFSESVCAVRINGRYGFIDTNGLVVIPAIYDYALPFNEGLSLVYKEGRPLFIDKQGKEAFNGRYAKMTVFKNGRAYVQTHSGKMGVIDKTGALKIDTLFRYVGPLRDGLAVVQGMNYGRYSSNKKVDKLEIGVVNENGEWIVPFGKYDEINGAFDGYFIAEEPSQNKNGYSGEVILNALGKEVFAISANESSWFEGTIKNGIIRVNKEIDGNGRYEYYVTVRGKMIYDDRETRYGNDFSEGYAFFRNKDDVYSLINKHGELVAKNRFDEVMENGFQGGMALVKTDQGWGVIDTTVQFILPPKFMEVHYVGIVDGYFFFQDSLTSEDEYPRFGLASVSGEIIIPPKFQFFDSRGFVDGLLTTWMDDRLTYFNKRGEKVWQEEKWTPKISRPLNIDYMNRGYYYANHNYTGHGNNPAHSEPKKILASDNFPGNVLSVVARSDKEYDFVKGIKGMVVFVANTTDDTIRFNAQDSRLYMKMQALNDEGLWRDIEYLPNSWCGNSYHVVSLPGNQYWMFVAPVYEGSFKTKLRIELNYVDPQSKPKSRRRGENQLVVYSNEFDGSINPAQFWRRPEYTPTDIMDPYNE